MTTITHMLKFHSQKYIVLTACGHHSFEVSVGDAKKRQLFVGKPIACPECDHWTKQHPNCYPESDEGEGSKR